MGYQNVDFEIIYPIWITFKNIKMKIFNITQRLLQRTCYYWLVVITSIFIYGCSDTYQSKYDEIVIDHRLDGMDGISVSGPNPLTGLPYTEEELSNLDYNPTLEEFYLSNQTVELSVWVEALPKIIEIEKDGDPTIIQTLDDFKTVENGYTATWTTSVEELGVPKTSNFTYTFYVSYDDVGVDGFPIPSENKISFTIHHKSDEGTAFVFLKTAIGEKKKLGYSGSLNDLSSNDNFGAYAELNGVNNYLTVSEDEDDLNFVNNGSFSVSFWVNTLSTDSDPSIIGNKDWGSGGNKGFVVAYLGGAWKVNIGDGEGGRADATGAVINDGAWHHISVTFEKSNIMKLYQDGVLITEEDISAIGDMTSGLPINIGQDGTGSYSSFFKGQLGDVVLSNYALSADEVKILSKTDSGVQLRTRTSVEVIEVQENGSTPTIEAGKITREFANNSYATVVDEGVLDFRFTQDYSIAFWVNTESTTSDPVMIGDQDWNSSGNVGLTLAFRGDNWRAVISDGATKADISTDGVPFNDGKWHLLTATFDRDGDMKIYQDGQVVANASMMAVGNANSGNPIRLAQDGTGSYGIPFEGKIANTVIFDYVLSADEVLKLLEQ